MNVTEKLERKEARVASLRKENGALTQRIHDVRSYFESKLADTFSNTSLATDDLLGGALGIGLYRGVSALYGWIGTPKEGKPPGFMKKHPWVSDAAQAVLSGGGYAASLLVGRNSGEQPGTLRSLARRASSTTLLMSLESLVRHGYAGLKAYSAQKALEDNSGA